ncbi:MAG: hypothetical protein HY537_18180 [Deltaproteobacteria bacterium]|nr:hypothetical protein [Deltaproteobacteria bacterium]
MHVTKVKQWGEFLCQVRKFFNKRGFLEVTTPHLVSAGAFESTLDPLSCKWSNGTGELHTSPEFEMKLLLSEIRLPIYQICQCFRDDPPSPVHKIEFTMLEFYRPFVQYESTQTEMKQLLSTVSGRDLEFKEYTVNDLVLSCTGLNLQNLSEEELRQQVDEKQIVSVSSDDAWEDIFFKIMLEHVEPRLDPAIPTLVKDYPKRVCALADINPVTQVAERFEIYWKGMELCNGATELTNLPQLMERFNQESRIRRLAGKNPHPSPDRLILALKKGLPPCSGVAVGLDRLFLCLS